MGKNKYNATNSSISDSIYTEYLSDEYMCKTDMLESKMEILIANNLAYRISGVEYLSSKKEINYRVASKFIQKYNKVNKNYRRKIPDYEFGGKNNNFDNTNKELFELTKYSLVSGTYYCQMDERNFARLTVKIEDGEYGSTVNYEFYIIGKNWKKWKDNFFSIIETYEAYGETSKEECILYTDGRPEVKAIFKPFDQVILKDKNKLLKYIDNFVNNIPIYYNKYHMISKLSIMLYGNPGTGKSTVARAIAKHLGITTITSIGPDYFDNPEDSRGRRRLYTREGTIFALDDIDCICKSRNDSTDRENNEILMSLLSFLDNPPTFYFKAKDGLSYPISIVIATTNYYNKLDDAVKRYGRFDLKIEMNEFNKEQAEEMCKLYDLKLSDLVPSSNDENFTISPSYLQALCLENIDKSLKKID
jgi:AAA+ superfamily predicted ATPase